MPELAPGVAEALGQLHDQGIRIFVPLGAEGMLSMEDGKLVIRSETLEVADVISCIRCGYVGEDLDHRCSGPVACPN